MASQVDTYQCEPGICLFINNTEFYGAGLADLEGGENDEASLRSTFENLGFDVRIRLNLTAAKMEFIAEEYSAMEHKGVFFLVISSHGGEGDIVYGTDGGEVKVHDLERNFYATQCPSLAGIPKVFMIDACRGNDDEPVYSFPSKSAPSSPGVSVTSKQVRAAADIMTIFAATRGYTAGYYESDGSILIQTFAQVIEEVPADKNLTGIMKIVQRKIQDPQTPQLESTFTKDYYIKSRRGKPSNALARRDAESREVDFRREYELHREFHRQLTFGEGSMMRLNREEHIRASQGPRSMFVEYTREQMYTYRY